MSEIDDDQRQAVVSTLEVLGSIDDDEDDPLVWRRADWQGDWDRVFGEDEWVDREDEDEYYWGYGDEDDEEDEWERDSEFANADEDEDGFYAASQPADEEVVENLPGIPGPVRRELFPEGWEENCVVCLEGIEGFRPAKGSGMGMGMGKGEEVVVSLPGCGHWFHGGCIKAWLSHHNTCPVCRKELQDKTIINTKNTAITTSSSTTKIPELCRDWVDHWLFKYWARKVPKVRFSRPLPAPPPEHSRAEWEPVKRDLAELNSRLGQDSPLYWANEMGWPIQADNGEEMTLFRW
ncbi:hypothetical protein QBC40DRAFT_329313 [Triangularia verruculosa]|uniref:RING-type domain-containing protein n=1 Tax=Triangularia verruculosa TaxID=2587418 RepID=A0AAN7B1D6_9PEZI|nr:hypothetical protein QBC40DRAFT_329313 [Triangularia verruculosa]